MPLHTSSPVRRLAAVTAVVALAGLLASCDKDDPIAPPVLTTVIVNLSKESLEIGDTSFAAASGQDHGGAALATGTVAWSVRDAAIATVDATGRVIGLAAGNTVVAGTAGGVVGERAITVTAPPEIVINEIESNGGTPGDWVELFNPGTTAVNVGGWGLKDDDDSRTFTFAAGTVIPAGGYLVAEEAQFGYGLGAADATRLYSRFGVLVASHTWTTHATTTYGRCPDGTGSFITMNTVTKGAANDCRPIIRINEVESNGGTPGDWIELYNAGPTTVDLSNFIVKDNDDSRTSRIPAGTTIAPGGFFVIEESLMGFGLGAPDAARIFDAAGTLIDSYEWTTHAATTYGRCPDATGPFITTTTSTKGTANDCRPLIRINEVESNGGTPGDWIELYNAGPTTVDLSNFIVKDNEDSRTSRIPAGTTIAPGGFFVIEESLMGFGLGAPDAARIYDAAGTLIDSYEWTAHATTTYGRCPNGAGAFVTMTTSTKGATNDCSPPAIRINEVESNGGTPGDWIELYNAGPTTVDLSNFIVKDNDDSRTSRIPAGTTIAPGGFFVIEESLMGFGLGVPDAARIYDAAGTLVDSYEWTAHAPVTYGRCPDATGPFVSLPAATKGAANDCRPLIRINEVESNGGTPGDWIELYNAGTTVVDLSNFIVKDNEDSRTTRIPAGTTIAPGGFFVIEEALMGFGLGAPDAARIYDATGTLIDSHEWTAHAATTYGRCPDGSGTFVVTTTSTKGAVNICTPVGPVAAPWPGDDDVQTVGVAGFFGSNLSGLAYEAAAGAAPAYLWAVRNGPGTLYRLVQSAGVWAADAAANWGAGKALRYPDGTGDVDAEGVAFAGTAAGGMYVAAERNNSASGVSRNSILRFDVSGAATTLTAINEWNLTDDLPANGANLGLEAITWVPDADLVARQFFDESKGRAYAPADYANHGTGLFFVGVEADGMIYAYALDHVANTFTRVATITTGFPGVMALEYDGATGYLLAVCDDGCGGLTGLLEIDAGAGSPTHGRFLAPRRFARPPSMPNLNNEGFALTPASECVAGRRSVFWSDDAETGGHSLRRASMQCGVIAPDMAAVHHR